MSNEKSIDEWFRLRDSFAEALEIALGEQAVAGITSRVEAERALVIAAESLMRGGWVTDWPEDEEDEDVWG
jgi:hypothetical protein